MNMEQQAPPDIYHVGIDVGQQTTGSKRRLRVYEQWQGNERFFCRGYLVAGPNWKATIGTAVLIMAPAGVYIGLVGQTMGRHVHVVILVFSCILPALSMLWLWLTACRDPGVIPRQEPDQEYLAGCKPRTKEVIVNGQRVVIRYNDTCHFYQPPRAHHCSVNDNCIERFDHHCPWVGTTIGKRNYRTFLLFVYTTTMMCMYVFGVCLANIFVTHDRLVDQARSEGKSSDSLWGRTLRQPSVPASLALMAYTFLFFWFVGGLSGFHCYLVATNQTTYENFRYNHDSRPNPYDRGILGNCAEVWCTPLPPSKVQFRAYADEWKPPTGQPQSPYCVIPTGPEPRPEHMDAAGGQQGTGGHMQQQQMQMQAPQEAAMGQRWDGAHPHPGDSHAYAYGGQHGDPGMPQDASMAAYDHEAQRQQQQQHLQLPVGQHQQHYGGGEVDQYADIDNQYNQYEVEGDQPYYYDNNNNGGGGGGGHMEEDDSYSLPPSMPLHPPVHHQAGQGERWDQAQMQSNLQDMQQQQQQSYGANYKG